VIIGLSLLVVVVLDGAHTIWKDKEKLRSATTHSPQVILDYEPFIDDQPRRRNGSWILRNTGPATAVNVLLEPFVIGNNNIVSDPVNRLLPSDTAKLTCEVRYGDEVRKPCLVQLERLFEVVLQDESMNMDTTIPLTIRYGDVAGRRYKVEYSVKYRVGINECLAEFKKLDVIG
jgi:hypothetical protein